MEQGGWTCVRCGEPIGVYEVTVVVEDDIERVTSRLNEPGPGPAGDAYHTTCWAEANAELP